MKAGSCFVEMTSLVGPFTAACGKASQSCAAYRRIKARSIRVCELQSPYTSAGLEGSPGYLSNRSRTARRSLSSHASHRDSSFASAIVVVPNVHHPRASPPWSSVPSAIFLCDEQHLREPLRTPGEKVARKSDTGFSGPV